jgi:sugar lactone lactonase YvrE
MRKAIRLLALSAGLLAAPILALGQPATAPVDNSKAPQIPFDSVEFGTLKPGQNFGEVLAVAVNSKGHVVVLNHPGTATSGPLYGNASTELLEFDALGNFVREIGHGVYGLGYGHSVRFDRYDNLWVVDKGTSSVMKFDPAGKVVMNLGRRLEGYDSGDYRPPKQADVTAQDGMFRAPTDVAWDQDDNIYVSDGYVNSRIAKFTKDGDWVKSWGKYGLGGPHANENPYGINNPHNIQIDRSGTIYVGDRGNRRIHVYDRDGKFIRFMYLNAPYDKSHHPTLGSLPADVSARPDESAPWALCITNTPTQYLYAIDSEPGRLYKMTLDGKIIGVLGISGHRPGQFNWPHSLACPSENTVFVADMNNWRVQKLTLHPERATPAR